MSSIFKGSDIYEGGGSSISTGTGGEYPEWAGANFGIATVELAACEGMYTPPGGNDGGSTFGTLVHIPISFPLRRLSCMIGNGIGKTGFRLLAYKENGEAIGRTAEFSISAYGRSGEKLISEIWDGSAWVPGSEYVLTGNSAVYYALYCPQAAAAAQFYGCDAGTTFGPAPWLAVMKANNNGVVPTNILTGASEHSVRLHILGAA